MNKVKVCHIVNALESGGVESVIYNYCSHLDLSKFEMHILYQRKASKKNIKEFERLGFYIKEIPEKKKHLFKNYYETKKYLKENEINVVHAHMTLTNFIPLLAAKKIGIKKRISHSHNSDVRVKKLFTKIIEFFCKKLTIKYATDYLACGKEAGKYLYLNKKFIILNNALDIEKFKFNKDKRDYIRKKYNIKSNEIVIGNIGRFTEQKNQKFLIDIFSKLNNLKEYKLMIVGDGTLKKQLEEIVKEKNLTNVIFTGIVENTSDFYSAFDVFALPSLWEGFPVVGVEAQASGLTCFFSNNIDNSSIILKDKVKLLKLNSKNWLYEFNNLKENNNIYNRNIKKIDFENKNLSIEKETKKLADIYLK